MFAHALLDVVSAAEHAEDPGSSAEVQAALNHLADLPRRVLADRQASHGRVRRIQARLARVDAGLQLEDEEDDSVDGIHFAAAATRRRTLSQEQLLALRVERMIGLGSVTRSARALVSEPLADTRSPAVIAALRDKHPAAEPPEALQDDCPPLSIDAEVLQRTLQRLEAKRGSAGGPTGMTYEHILAATKGSVEALNATVAFVNLMLSGRLPHLGSLLDSSLIGLQKPDGGVRPIAIGEVLYRLTGLCALTALEEIGKSLAPLQLAVGVSGGVEALVHAIRSALEEDPETALLTVDMANAFNTVDRSALLAAVKKRAPSLLPYVQWSYIAATDLHIMGAPAGTEPVKSRTGVRQGDTLAMLLFGLVLQDVLERTRDAAPAVACLSIADDVNLVGKVDALRTAFQTLVGEQGAAGVGLRVQQRKCAITAGPPEGVNSLAAELGVRHCPEGVTVCGTPIGANAFVAEALSKRADGIIAQVDKLMQLPVSRQSQFILLRSSLSLRMAHLMRTVPWQNLEASTSRVEGAIADATAAIFQLPSHGAASAPLRTQMLLPLRHGGFGLRGTTPVEANAALVAGASKAQAAMQGGQTACKPFSGATRESLLTAWQAVWDLAAGDCEWDVRARDLPPDFVLETLPSVQSVVSRLVGDRAGAAFLASFDPSTPHGRRAAARIHSVANGPASAWLTALPVTPTMRLGNDDFAMAGRHRLGLGVPAPVDMPPCRCTSGDSSTPDHAMSCNKLAGEATMRHNMLTSVWRDALSRAGCATSVEPRYSSIAPPGTQSGSAGQRRGDIFAMIPGGRAVVLDCVVTHPAAASYVMDAAVTPGSAAEKAERRKQRSFQEFGEGSAYDFVPLAIESYGRLGLAASRFLSELGDIAAEGGQVCKESFVRGVRRELSCALCKGNGRIYRAFLSSIAHSVGRHYRPGCDLPVQDPCVL